MKKIRFWLLLILATLLTAFLWYLKTSLWLERLLAYGFAPPQGKSWAAEVEKFSRLYPSDGMQCIFLGDSHMEQCEWQELFPDYHCANRGIGGETTEGLLLRLHSLPLNGSGKTIFLQIGVNDLFAGKPCEEILGRYRQILDSLKSRQFRVVPSLVFPLRYLPEVNRQLPALNRGLQKLAAENDLAFIDLNSAISKDNKLLPEFSHDGVHLNAKGYALWAVEIRKQLPRASASGFR
jgi:lysophospholipase L1-like esterase